MKTSRRKSPITLCHMLTVAYFAAATARVRVPQRRAFRLEININPTYKHHIDKDRRLSSSSASRPSSKTMPPAPHIDRFYADRNTPFCSLEVAQAFAQLRLVMYRLIDGGRNRAHQNLARRRRNTRTTSHSQAGQAPGLSKVNGRHRHPICTICSY